MSSNLYCKYIARPWDREDDSTLEERLVHLLTEAHSSVVKAVLRKDDSYQALFDVIMGSEPYFLSVKCVVVQQGDNNSPILIVSMAKELDDYCRGQIQAVLLKGSGTLSSEEFEEEKKMWAWVGSGGLNAEYRCRNDLYIASG